MLSSTDRIECEEFDTHYVLKVSIKGSCIYMKAFDPDKDRDDALDEVLRDIQVMERRE